MMETLVVILLSVIVGGAIVLALIYLWLISQDWSH